MTLNKIKKIIKKIIPKSFYNKSTNIELTDIEKYIKQSGHLIVEVGGRAISLDLKNKHERAYAAKSILNIRHPQSDIDTFLFRRFINKGDKVLDAGANIGYTALEMLEEGASKVLAVEAMPDIFKRLNGLSSERVECLNSAIGSSDGIVSMRESTLHNQGASYKNEMVDIFPDVFKGGRSVNVKMTSIDLITERFCNFNVWKVDIEGAECDLILGAKKTLSKTPPRVIIAEIYDKFLHDFIKLTSDHFKYVYRAYITKNYDLVLIDIKNKQPEDVYSTSPMYVFLNESQSYK